MKERNVFKTDEVKNRSIKGKTIAVLLMIALIIVQVPLKAFATECPGQYSPDGRHHDGRHVLQGQEYETKPTKCTYFAGYDSNHEKVYKDDCRAKSVYDFCDVLCAFCDTTVNRHAHYLRTIHSKPHFNS